MNGGNGEHPRGGVRLEMVDYYWEHHSTYRGIEIVVLMPGSLAYGAMLGGYLRTEIELSDIRARIDDYLGPEEPEPDPIRFIETYRGHDIYFYEPGYYPGYQDDGYATAAIDRLYAYLPDLRSAIDILIDVPPEPEPELEFIEIYRGLAIYFWPSTDEWRGYYTASGGVQYGPYSTLQACRDKIDELVGPVPGERVYVETYRGIDIYYEAYAGMYFYTVDNVEHYQPTMGQAHTHIDTLLAEPEPEWQFIEIYRGLAIYFWPSTDEWRGYYTASGGVSYGPYSTLQACRAKIDELMAPTEIPTSLTIFAPGDAAVNERFFISGTLYEKDSGIPIPNQPINHSYNGRSLGSSTTGVNGNYLKEVSIPESGTWTLKSEFLGADIYQTSRALVDAVVGAPPIVTALLIAGPIVTGLALVTYGSR